MRSDSKKTESKPVQELKQGLAQDEGALSRWSRRKQQALDSSRPQSPPFPVDDSIDNEVEQPVLTDADMPPVEDLSEDSDYSGFLSPGVSEELRAMALRKLFRSAKFNVCDGLDDYDDDFRALTLLKDVLVADATANKLKDTDKPDAHDEPDEPVQPARNEASPGEERTSDENSAVQDETADTRRGQQSAQIDDEVNDESMNDEESGTA